MRLTDPKCKYILPSFFYWGSSYVGIIPNSGMSQIIGLKKHFSYLFLFKR